LPLRKVFYRKILKIELIKSRDNYFTKSPLLARIVPYNDNLKLVLIQFRRLICKAYILRIDKFLNSVNITKRRSISEDMCKSGVVSINNTVVKPAKMAKIGDIISIKYLDKVVRYEVLQIPQTKTIPKSAQSEYVKVL